MKIAFSFMIGASLLVAGCGENEQVSQCRSALESGLKSPSSLAVVKEGFFDLLLPVSEAETSYILPVEPKISKSGKGGIYIRIVTIEYDADNSFGASLRDEKICHYVQHNDGRWEETGYNFDKDPKQRLRTSEQIDAESAELMSELKEATKASDAAINDAANAVSDTIAE